MNVSPLLVVPLVGGYAFSTILKASIYHASRESGHRLYFRSVFYAFFLVICAALVHVILYSAQIDWYQYWLHLIYLSTQPPNLLEHNITITGIESKISVLILPLFLGPILAKFINLPGYLLTNKSARLPLSIFPKKFAIALLKRCERWELFVLKHAICSNDFEMLILKSFQEYFPMLVTLETGKVYVGWAVKAPNPVTERKCLRIFPLLSGFRDSNTHVVNFTSKYVEVFEKLKDNKRFIPAAFEVVVPTTQITSIHLFDIDVYEKYFATPSVIKI